MENHPRDDNLERSIDAYLKGQLSEEEVQELWIQLMKQPEYISMLQTEVDVARIYKSEAKNKPIPLYYWKWIASAAAIILLVVSINVLSDNEQKSIDEWSQEFIVLADNLSSAEVKRSSTNTLDTADSLLNTGFKAAVSGQHQTAMAIFEKIIAQYDSDGPVSKAHLNLGILKYNAGDFEGSIDNFKNAISTTGGDSLLIEQSYWYLGNALINTDQLQKAREAVEHAHEIGNIYKNEAFKLLKRLDYELGNIDYDDFKEQIQESK